MDVLVMLLPALGVGLAWSGVELWRATSTYGSHSVHPDRRLAPEPVALARHMHRPETPGTRWLRLADPIARTAVFTDVQTRYDAASGRYLAITRES